MNDMDPYTRIVMLFDKDETAGSFLAEDGDGGFTGAIYRMAREIDKLRLENNSDIKNEKNKHIRVMIGDLTKACIALGECRVLAAGSLYATILPNNFHEDTKKLVDADVVWTFDYA